MANKGDGVSRPVTIHVFTNGSAIFDFGETLTPEQVEVFREMYTKDQKSGQGLFFLAQARVEVITHDVPLGRG